MNLRRRLLRKARRLQLVTEQARVMIGTPAQDTCHASYVRSIVRCIAYSIANGQPVTHEIVQYSILPLSRQLLAQLAIESGATHLLFVDSDMEFPHDLVVRLVQHHQPVVAINCMARRKPYNLTARDESGREIMTTPESSGIEKVARVGTGILLVHLDVFRAIPMPWFTYEWLPEKASYRGEDYCFCDRVREAGFEIYVDHDLSKEVSHVGSFQYNPLMRAGFLEVEEVVQRHAQGGAQEVRK